MPMTEDVVKDGYRVKILIDGNDARILFQPAEGKLAKKFLGNELSTLREYETVIADNLSKMDLTLFSQGEIKLIKSKRIAELPEEQSEKEFLTIAKRIAWTVAERLAQ